MDGSAQAALDRIAQDVERIYQVVKDYPWASRPAYAQWMAQTYFYTRHASRVSAHAALRTPMEREELHHHLVGTLVNEKDHPPMLLRDLDELGYRIDDFSEHPLTSCIYQTLHYQIDTVGPFALIGYFFVIEGIAAQHGQEILDRVQLAYAGQGQSFLAEHVRADAEHYPQAQAFVGSLAATELAIVVRCATLAASLYCYMIDAIRQEHAGT